MKLGHVFSAPLLVLIAGACSDPPSEPAEAAIIIRVQPAGGSCNASRGELGIPQDQRAFTALNCDLTTGCKPGDYVVVDGRYQHPRVLQQ